MACCSQQDGGSKPGSVEPPADVQCCLKEEEWQREDDAAACTAKPHLHEHNTVITDGNWGVEALQSRCAQPLIFRLQTEHIT